MPPHQADDTMLEDDAQTNKTNPDFLATSSHRRKAYDRQTSSSSFNTVSTIGSEWSAQPILDEDGNVFESRLLQVANQRRWERHESVLDVIGQTPVVRLQRMAPPGVEVYVKCENLNPGGSLKDRLALGVIEWAEKSGKLKPGQTVIEASSGNTGIGLAMVCASKGYPFVCVMSEAFSIERRKLMRFLGARVILTPKEYKATGMLIKGKQSYFAKKNEIVSLMFLTLIKHTPRYSTRVSG